MAAPSDLPDSTPAIPAAPPDSIASLLGLRAEWSATYASSYSFQGLDYSEGRPVLQPQMILRLSRFSLGVWGNLDQVHRELDEVDATLQGDWERGPLSGDAGYVHLQYPHRVDWEPTHEVFVDLALDRLLQPSLSVHWDVDRGRGRYWTLGLSHELSGSKTSAGFSMKLYAHQHYYEMTGIPALETNLSVTRAWAGFSLQPSLSRLWTQENGGFRGDQAVASGWLVALTVSPG